MKECVNVTSLAMAATPSSFLLAVFSAWYVLSYFSVVCAFVMGLWLGMLFPVSPQAQTHPVTSSQLLMRFQQRQRHCRITLR